MQYRQGKDSCIAVSTERQTPPTRVPRRPSVQRKPPKASLASTLSLCRPAGKVRSEQDQTRCLTARGKD
eukprot:scaffold1757_cov266-Pinguiococcus_pyrenoidosus.AAC.5